MDLVNLTMFYCSDAECDTFPPAFPPMTALLCKYFKKSLQLKDRPYSEYTYEEKDSAIASVYRDLCMSRHFLSILLRIAAGMPQRRGDIQPRMAP